MTRRIYTHASDTTMLYRLNIIASIKEHYGISTSGLLGVEMGNFYRYCLNIDVVGCNINIFTELYRYIYRCFVLNMLMIWKLGFLGILLVDLLKIVVFEKRVLYNDKL